MLFWKIPKKRYRQTERIRFVSIQGKKGFIAEYWICAGLTLLAKLIWKLVPFFGCLNFKTEIQHSLTVTVHRFPFSLFLTPNCIDCGMARMNADIHISRINFTTRDSFDIVCCLQLKHGKVEYIKRKLFCDSNDYGDEWSSWDKNEWMAGLRLSSSGLGAERAIHGNIDTLVLQRGMYAYGPFGCMAYKRLRIYPGRFHLLSDSNAFCILNRINLKISSLLKLNWHPLTFEVLHRLVLTSWLF